jgi:hypothetical protein
MDIHYAFYVTETQFLNLIYALYTTVLIRRRAMAQAVSRRPVTAETCIGSRASPCGICGELCGNGIGRTSFIPPMLHVHLHLKATHYQKEKRAKNGNLQTKERLFGHRGRIGQKSTLTSS